VFSGVRQGLSWFIDGLVDAWTALASRLRRRSRIALVPTADGYAIETPDGKHASQLLQIEDGEGGYRFTPPALAATLRNSDVDIVPPPDEILTRTLDPLPGESRQYLDSIVRHQLERLAPWRADDVLYAYRIAPDGRSSEALHPDHRCAGADVIMFGRLTPRSTALHPRNQTRPHVRRIGPRHRSRSPANQCR
jgi:hypothetical protein